ncbi:IPT/TIG domain-containing protein [Geobacter argillaceus]|uniref:IPT/TIG domain-containing protein n=1 Tax=Geobacter argillaceus TaxID=345631 RepID=A0A562WRD3_9BACT|nr:IPT/TIG domain-containing protein [Geobacter argillaceus]TWJ32958.1 IPT/TIG domain-containing protein [Geobacter argillaceus]
MPVRLPLLLLLLLTLAQPVLAQTSVKAPAAKPAIQTKQPPAQPSPAILSIIPAQAEPAATVTLSGSGFTAKTTVFLGSTEIAAQVIDAGHLSFTLPALEPGIYALYLRREDGIASRTYSFTVQPLKPTVSDISPDSVPFCATGTERNVTVVGSNFRKGALVLFDGVAVRSRYVSSESISFTVPQIKGGLHQVQVKNSDETASGAVGLLIDTKPEISNVSRGEDYVNYYNLIIEGRNFLQNSTIVVMEERTFELTGQSPMVDVRRLSSGSGGGAERDRVTYVNCNRIIYQRYPYSPVSKSFQVQVINPGGEESATVSVSAP